MMSSPDTVVSGAGGWGRGGSGGGGPGARLAAGAMPLQAACLCRALAPAALARLHVVTPKAPVHVTLDPKVQPVPGGPVFVPRLGEPAIKLSSSAYWVLRFPYVYEDERGALPRPHGSAPALGTVLPHMFGLQE